MFPSDREESLHFGFFRPHPTLPVIIIVVYLHFDTTYYYYVLHSCNASLNKEAQKKEKGEERIRRKVTDSNGDKGTTRNLSSNIHRPLPTLKV